ncbi:hypothetical protein BO219_06395 [Anoxybacillus kestanbolensis]|uniref:Uncharacterized protein n=1 Tax=Anoxybacillus kestanbolensis TaxID=227476 RepID=A0A1V3FTH3_9BACL|nr:hypothetical protein [Anoxybacillus kestanbolensis]OOE05012.1 hypothetical protein BO219_06395 [Anoxybacillus kestanbolensis]
MNKKEIMKKAVALAKTMVGDWVARMALALKTVWAEVKKMGEKVLPALKGTEKQVTWANDIRNKLIPIVEKNVDIFITKLENAEFFEKKDDAYRAKKKEEIKAAFNEFINKDHADYWIYFTQTNVIHRGRIDEECLLYMFSYQFLNGRVKSAFDRMRSELYL